MIMKIIFVILSAILIFINQHQSYAQFSPEQNARIDSLNKIIKKSEHDTLVAHAYVELTEILALSDLDTVFVLCEKAITIADKNLADNSIDSKEKKAFQLVLALAYNNIGTIHFYKGEIPSALKFYDKSIKIKEEIGDKKSLVTSLNNLGAIYIHLGESTLALEQFHKALKVSDGIEDETGKAISLSNIGAVYRQQGNISLALQNYNEALKIREKTGDKMGTSNSLNNIGAIYKGLGNISLALDYHHRALKIREELGDKIGIGNSLNNIGLIYYEQHDIPSAINYYNKALQIREELGDQAGIATSLNNIGAIYKNQGNMIKALDYFQKSLKIEKEIGDKSGIASTLNNIGFIHKEQGDTQLAFDCFQESLSIGKQLGNQMEIIYSLVYLGHIFVDQGNYSQAIHNGKEALALAKEMGFVKEIEESGKLLYEALKKNGEYKEALEMHELYAEMHDSLINQENTRAVTIQDMNYKHEKEKQAELLARTEKEHKEELRHQREDQIRYAGIGFIILISLIGFFITRNRQRKKELLQQQKLNEKLKHIDKLKDQFLANTSHELRTPLNGIIGLSESLREGVAGEPSENMKNDLEMIISSGKRLSGLINDILDFSKLREKDIVLKLKPIDLYTAVEVDLRIVYPSTIGKPVKLLNQIPKDIVAVNADESRLQQIMLNLVSNAIKFTKEGAITISAVQKEDMVFISVKDTGIGIPKDKLESIFDAFDQVDASIEREYGGTGLGLNIARQLVELHGGSIEAESEQGKGSVLTFSLPVSLEKAIKPSEGIAITRPKIITGVVTDQKTEVILGVGNFCILVVDDDPVNRQVLVNYLKEDTFRVIQAEDGLDALKVLENNTIDLVLLDVMMPGMSGFEVCQRIREKHLSSELPVIMVTAKDQVVDLVQGLNIGANDYLIKPVSRDEMLARIKTQLNLLKINNSYSRFVPREFLHSLGKEDILDVKLGDQTEGNITVMFSDIRSYTSLSESMTVNDNFRFLNSYFGKIGPVIQKNHGFVNQFLGDGIMALFQTEPENALIAAIEMQKVVDDYNIYRIKKDRAPISIGTGLHYGSLMLGIIGDDKRMDAGVVSDTVNTASRVEGLTKYYGASIVLSEDLVSQIRNLDKYHHRFLGKVLVKGKNKTLSVYEFFGGDVKSTIDQKEKTKKDFENGLDAYYNRHFTEAAVLFKKILETNENDLAAQMYLRQSAAYMVQGPPEDWAGTQKMNDK